MIKMIIAINDHGHSYCFDETQFVVYKFDTICKTPKGNPFLYFQYEDFTAFQLLKFQWH